MMSDNSLFTETAFSKESMEKKIAEVLTQYPDGLNSSQIASIFGVEKSEVNSALYRSKDFLMSEDYIWRLISSPAAEIKKSFIPRAASVNDPMKTGISKTRNANKTLSMNCPKCGAPMILREAKSGQHAGQKFWGCSMFPRCKEIVDIDIPLATLPQPTFSESPLQFYASPLTGMNDMQAYQTIAVRASSLSRIRNRLIDDKKLLLKSRFRLDFSKPGYRLDREQSVICALVLRMLCRGSITINSPRVEAAIDRMFPPNDEYSDEAYIYCGIDCTDDFPVTVDSERERSFISDYLAPLLGKNWANYVSTQVHIGSLLTKNANDVALCESFQRVDFLISHNGKDVIVEIDGQEHLNHREKDHERDEALKRNGYQVLRFQNQEIDEQDYLVTRQLKQAIGVPNSSNPNQSVRRAISATKLVHQIQVALVSALYNGVFPCDANIKPISSSDLFSSVELEQLLDVAIDDLQDLFENFCKLYGVSAFFECLGSKNGTFGLCIGCVDTSTATNVVISDVGISKNIATAVPSVDSLEIVSWDENILQYFLQYVFRFPSFKEGQQEGIERILSRNDSIILLPTGSGKSLIYQLSSLLVPGKIIVISPLTSLILDQIDNLFYQGIDCASAIYRGKATDVSDISLSDSRMTMTYISPERLQVRSFRDSIDNLLIKNSVFAVAVDEAHCVSEWGHDFRTAYLNIGRTSRKVFQKNGRIPVIIALTGTASTAVLKDVQRELNIHDYDAIITPQTFDRKELRFHVFKSSSNGKQRQLNSIINDYMPSQFQQNAAKFYGLNNDNSNSGIVFCPHVNGDFGVQKVYGQLATFAPSDYYSGGIPKGFNGNWDAQKRKVSSAFKSNQINLLVATKAFGMGIDKPNVRFTVHYGIPGSIESFYQEAGRAGRDGKEAWCVILLSDDNHVINEKLLDPSTPLEVVTERINKQNIEDNDDISRVLYFHVKSFKGVQFELERVSEIVKIFFANGELADQIVIIKCGRDEENNSLDNIQRALQRLLVLGIVSDYTVDYSSKEIYANPGKCDETSISFNYANYVRGYNEGRVITEIARLNAAIGNIKGSGMDIVAEYIVAAAKVLIEFIYDTIEKGRRRGLREMIKVAEAALSSSDQDHEVRMRIVRYFESTYSVEIDSVIESTELGFDRIPVILDGTVNDVGEKVGGIRSANEAMGLRGQVSRYLESTPDHPGLLALRALSELYCKDYDPESVEVDFSAFIDFALNRYSCTEKQLIDFLVFFVKKAFERDEDISSHLYNKAMDYINSEILCSRFLESNELSDIEKSIPASIFFNWKLNHVLNTIKNVKGEQ